MKYIIIILFFSLIVLGQDFSRTSAFRGAAELQARPTIVAFSPTDLSGLAYRWIGGAITQDTQIRWIDSIQNRIMAMDGPDAVHYTNITGGGVWFDGSQGFGFHAAEIAVTNWSIWLCMKPDTIDPAANAMFADENGVYLFRNNQAAVNIYLGGNNLFGSTVVAATGIDILATDNGTLTVYTNGLSAGSLGGKTNVFYFYVIGRDAFNAKIAGKIYEICVWSNTILTSINATNLHKYGTNKYIY